MTVIPSGELARAITHEPNDDYPTYVDIVAYYGERRKGYSKRVTITADQFFGRRGYGAPMTGDDMLRIIEKLRKAGPKA